jgi:hypothetical protein
MLATEPPLFYAPASVKPRHLVRHLRRGWPSAQESPPGPVRTCHIQGNHSTLSLFVRRARPISTSIEL